MSSTFRKIISIYLKNKGNKVNLLKIRKNKVNVHCLESGLR